jgi:hypothetical protein
VRVYKLWTVVCLLGLSLPVAMAHGEEAQGPAAQDPAAQEQTAQLLMQKSGPQIAEVQLGEVRRQASDECQLIGGRDGEGEGFSCARVFHTSTGGSCVFKYNMVWTQAQETTDLQASCLPKAADSEASCEQDPPTPELSACWDEAVDQKLLLGHRKGEIHEGADIGCSSNPVQAEVGYTVSINRVGDAYFYEFGQISLGPLPPLAQEQVAITVDRKAADCTLTVVSLKTQKPRFSVRLSGGGSEGPLAPAQQAGSPVPDMTCRVRPQILTELCAPVQASGEAAPTPSAPTEQVGVVGVEPEG